jgi:aminopeptidase-like protein
MLFLFLYQMLKRRRNKYTYRLFIQPETIGVLASLSRGIIAPPQVEYALVATCVGKGESVNYKKTHSGEHTLDRAVQRVLATKGVPHKLHAFWPEGSDERQLSSPGVRIPAGSLMGDMYQRYPEYHTSADDLASVSLGYIKKMARLYYDVMMEYEKHPKLRSTVRGGEPFLTKHRLYRSVSVPGHDRPETIRSWILFLADGRHTVIDVAAESRFSVQELEPHVRQLVRAGLIREID